MSISVDEAIPDAATDRALAYMKMERGENLVGKSVDVVFIVAVPTRGSTTFGSPPRS